MVGCGLDECRLFRSSAEAKEAGAEIKDEEKETSVWTVFAPAMVCRIFVCVLSTNTTNFIFATLLFLSLYTMMMQFL